MKTNIKILSLFTFIITSFCLAAALPTDPAAKTKQIMKRLAEAPPQPKGYVFQPEMKYGKDYTKIIMKFCPVHEGAQALANLTGSEVFVSYKIQNFTLPHVDTEGSLAVVASELIQKIESIENANIAVIELSRSTLAIIQKDLYSMKDNNAMSPTKQ